MTLGPLKFFLQHSEELITALYGLFAISSGAKFREKTNDISFVLVFNSEDSLVFILATLVLSMSEQKEISTLIIPRV